MKKGKNGTTDAQSAELRKLSDTELMARSASGNESAFACLVNRYAQQVLSMVYRYTADRRRSEEITLEVFVRLYAERRHFRAGTKFRVWLFTMAFNLAKREVPSSIYRYQPESGAESTGSDDLIPIEGPDASFEGEGIHGAVGQAIRRLPEPYRAAVVLRDVSKLACEEISEILEIPNDAFRARLQRARTLLSETLLPVAQATSTGDPTAMPAEPAAEPDSAGRPAGAKAPTVLLVEDEESVRYMLLNILRRNGYRVIQAENAAAALEAVRLHSGPIEITVTDVAMPGMSGVELAQRLLALRPQMKVLYMSGYVVGAIDPSISAEAHSAFLQKPFKPDQLLQAVDQAIQVPVQRAAENAPAGQEWRSGQA